MPEELSMERKHEEILDCLAGRIDASRDKCHDHHGKSVDLWRLRELALERGGLLCPSVRQRAWPTLVGALNSSGSTETSAHVAADEWTDVSSADLDACRRAVRHTRFHLQDFLKSSNSHKRDEGERPCLPRRHAKQEHTSSSSPSPSPPPPPQREDEASNRLKKTSRTALTENDHVVSLTGGRRGGNGMKRVSFADALPTEVDGGAADGCFSPQWAPVKEVVFERIAESSPSSSTSSYSPIQTSFLDEESFLRHDVGDDLDHDDHGPLTLPLIPATATPVTEKFISVSSWRKTRHRQHHKASVEEQKIVFNVLMFLLKKRVLVEDKVAGGCEGEGHHNALHFFEGFQDLVGALVIQLQSPSLTCLVLQKLSMHHLRSSFAGTTNAVLALPFWTLMALVDSELCRRLKSVGSRTAKIKQETTAAPTDGLPPFVYRWLLSWFGQDAPNLDIAVRLIDTLLVSHPLMSIYLATAMLTHHQLRNFILSEEATLGGGCWMHGHRSGTLPENVGVVNLDENKETMMEHIEDIIETAISYMSRIPPSDLLSRSKHDTGQIDDRVDDSPGSSCTSSSTVLGVPDAPAWSTAGRALTDWALLQRRREQATSSPTALYPQNVNYSRYPLATVAAGLGSLPSATCIVENQQRKRPSATPFVVHMLLFLLVIAAVVTAFSLMSSTLEDVSPLQPFPSEKKYPLSLAAVMSSSSCQDPARSSTCYLWLRHWSQVASADENSTGPIAQHGSLRKPKSDAETTDKKRMDIPRQQQLQNGQVSVRKKISGKSRALPIKVRPQPTNGVHKTKFAGLANETRSESGPVQKRLNQQQEPKNSSLTVWHSIPAEVVAEETRNTREQISSNTKNKLDLPSISNKAPESARRPSLLGLVRQQWDKLTRFFRTFFLSLSLLLLVFLPM